MNNNLEISQNRAIIIAQALQSTGIDILSLNVNQVSLDVLEKVKNILVEFQGWDNELISIVDEAISKSKKDAEFSTIPGVVYKG